MRKGKIAKGTRNFKTHFKVIFVKLLGPAIAIMTSAYMWYIETHMHILVCTSVPFIRPLGCIRLHLEFAQSEHSYEISIQTKGKAINIPRIPSHFPTS
jgi:hypothetical protein